MVTVPYQYMYQDTCGNFAPFFQPQHETTEHTEGTLFLEIKNRCRPVRECQHVELIFQPNARKNGPPFRSVCVSPSCGLETTLVIIEPRGKDFQHTFDDYEQNFIADELRLRISSDV